METIFFNPDNRKDPKTELFCICCHKDIKPENVKNALRVTVIEGTWRCRLDENGKDLLGKDCFKKLKEN